MQIYETICKTYEDHTTENIEIRQLTHTDFKKDLYSILKNIETHRNKQHTYIFVMEDKKHKIISGVGCVSFVLTKKYRIGLIGKIYNIHMHSSIIDKKNEFIQEMADYAIEKGCYTCTLENL
tara:strand:- start:2274 stop:2639 length:366 start_codon:yes stop_codon:yes gene_type:complete